jgi:N-methylhydantoinase A
VTVRVAVAEPASALPEGEPEPAEERGERETHLGTARVVRGVPESLTGPAIVELPESTVVVPPGWRCSAVSGGMRMEREPSTR